MLCLAFMTLLAQAPPPELLEQLARHDERMRVVTERGAFHLSAVVDELDDRGKTVKQLRTEYEIDHPGGARRETVLSHLEDGVDRTAQFKAERARKKEDAAKAPSPFATQAQRDYQFAVLPPSDAHPGWVHLAFSPRGEKKPELLIGDAWVDPAVGELRRMSCRPSKMPFFVDSMSIELVYDAQGPTGTTLSRMELRGSGGFAFVRRRLATVLLFSAYRANE